MVPNYAILESLISHSVKVGGLLVPANSLESYLGKFSLNLVVKNDDEIFKVSLVGSATPIFYRNQYFLLCSRHQLRGVNPEYISIMFPDGSHVVTSSGVRMFKETELTRQTDEYDVAAFNFSEPVNENPDLKSFFFKFDSSPPDTSNSQIVAFVLSGYPSADQEYEIAERNHIGLVKRIVLAQPGNQPSDPALRLLNYVEELDFAPDGLSGGPVFVVQEVGGEHRAYWAGIQLRSGTKQARILKVSYLQQFLDVFADEI